MAKASSEPRRAMALGATALSMVKAVKAVPISPGFSMTVNGLVLHGQPDFAKSERAGLVLRTAERGAQFAIGDYVLYIEDKFGEQASQILDFEGGWSEKTVAVYRWIASRIGEDIRRMDRLGIKHHMLVAPLSPTLQKKWLDKAAADDEDKPWTCARLKAALQAGQDLPPEEFFVMARVASGAAQDALMETLEAQGLACKAIVRRSRKKQEAA